MSDTVRNVNIGIIHRFKHFPAYVYLVLALVAALLIELFAFNASYFTYADDYRRFEVELPWQENLNRSAVIIDPEHASLTVNRLNFPVSNLYLETWSPVKHRVSVRISMTDSYHRYYAFPVTRFDVVPGGDNSGHLARIWDKGVAQSLTVSFASEDVRGGLALTKLVLNEQPSLEFSFLRLFLMWAFLGTAMLILRFRFYGERYDASKRLHKAINVAILSLMLALSAVVFYLNNPRTTEPFGFDFLGNGVMILTDTDHTILRDLPRNEDELADCDAFVQQLDAFLKGQLHLDFTVDPRMSTMFNVYDQSERGQYENLRYLYDRPYYKGKQFVYFGLAPLIMIYAPVYLLTGMVPCLALASFIGSVLCVFAVYAALNFLVSSFIIRPNALIFFLAEVAGILSLLLFSMQMYPSHYLMVYFTSIFWISVMVCCVAVLNRDGLSLMKMRICLTGVGISVVMIVLSRPLMVFPSLLLLMPFSLDFIKRQCGDVRALIKNALYAVIPVTAGAGFVMWYNYARFDSVFEFGANYQITGQDIRGEKLIFSLDILKSALWYYFFEPVNYLKNFPFVEYPSFNSGDDGGYRYIVTRISIFAIPMYLALFFLVKHMVCGKQLAAELGVTENFLKRFNWSAGCVVILVMILSYVVYIKFGIGYRYQTDNLSVLVYVAFLLLLTHVRYEKSKGGTVIYWVTVFLLLKSIVLCFLLTFSNFEGSFSAMNPDAYVSIQSILDPLGFK